MTYSADEMALILRTTLARMQRIVDGAVAGGNLGEWSVQHELIVELQDELEMGAWHPRALAIAQAEQEAFHGS